MCTALPEDNVARNDQLQGGFLCTEAFAGALGGFVGSTFGGVGGGAGEDERGEEGTKGRREGEKGKEGVDVSGRHNYNL